MNTGFSLTERDRELLQALVLKVRLFSQKQIADHWWEGQLPNARRRLKRLASQGLVTSLTVQAQVLPAIEAPLVTWQPEEPMPDIAHVAYCCQRRWGLRPVRPCTAWIATDTAAQLYGGAGRGELKLATQATHDLGVAAVWLRLSRFAPEWASAWRSEDLMIIARRGEKRPDAFLLDATGQVTWVLEFGGHYDKARVEAFHLDCQDRQLPYQIW